MAVFYTEVRDPKQVRRGELEHAAILSAIQLLRKLKYDDDRITEIISEEYNLILPYAKNYVVEYDQELALHILPWESN